MKQSRMTQGSGVVERTFQSGPMAGQRGLFATRHFSKNDVLLAEWPMVATQNLWNRDFKYLACSHCMRSLETAASMAARLSGCESCVLPFAAECDATDANAHCSCPACGEMYCSTACASLAADEYHKILCIGSKDNAARKAHLVSRMEEVWKLTFQPPESMSIVMVLRLLAMVQQKLDTPPIGEVTAEEHLRAASAHLDFVLRGESQFDSEDNRHVRLKIFDAHEKEINSIWQLVCELFPDERLGVFRTFANFTWMIAAILTNAIGVGTSSLDAYEKAVEAHLSKSQMSQTFGRLRAKISEESGPFQDCEGSALFRMHSAINHSCAPNSVSKYRNNNARLEIVAMADIMEGEEIFACYIDDVSRRVSDRRSELRTYYLFDCKCSRCVTEERSGDLASGSVGNQCSEVDHALKLLAHIDAGRFAQAVEMIPATVSKSSVQRLDQVCSEAGAAMENFEVICSDKYGSYRWDDLQLVGSIARRILETAARCVVGEGLSVTHAILHKSHAKAFGGKQLRRDAVASAFVGACSFGVMNTVMFYLDSWNDVLASTRFQPISLRYDRENGDAPLAWQQGAADAILKGHSDVAFTVLSRFKAGTTQPMHYFAEDLRGPTSYRDAFCSFTQRRMVLSSMQPERLCEAFKSGQECTAFPSRKRVKRGTEQ